MKKSYIYKILNSVNNKIYIGQTSTSLIQRFKEHQYNHKRKNYNYAIYKAMNKYGFDKFSIHLIEVCDKETVNDREIYWIKYYKTTNKAYGYNMIVKGGGPSNGHPNEFPEYVKKIVTFLKNTNLTFEEISIQTNYSKITISRINNGVVWYDYRIDYPIRKQILKSVQENIKQPKFICEICGKKVWTKSKRCIKHSIRNLEIIKRCSKEKLITLLVDNNYNKKLVGKILNVADNTIKKWAVYYGIKHTPNRPKRKERVNKSRKIYQLDENNKIINCFNNISDASIHIGITPKRSHIYSVCLGKRKSAYGYKWCYVEEYSNGEEGALLTR